MKQKTSIHKTNNFREMVKNQHNYEYENFISLMEVDEPEMHREKHLIENVLVEEFPKFVETRNRKRKELLMQNNKIKEKIVFSLKKIPKIDTTKIFQKSLNNINSAENKITLAPTIFIPRGIFVYPCEESFRTEECFEIKYMVQLDKFSKLDELIDHSKIYFDDWFIDYPHTLDASEKIENKGFLIWSFIEVVKQMDPQIINNRKIEEIIHLLAEIISKKIHYVYKFFSLYFNNLFKKIKNDEKLEKKNM